LIDAWKVISEFSVDSVRSIFGARKLSN
jgi:hypothetical protein